MKKTSKLVTITAQHPFHLVKASPWPFLTGLIAFLFLLIFVSYMHKLHLFASLCSTSAQSIKCFFDGFINLMTIVLLPLSIIF
jgi:hypothetical protein